LFDAVYEGVGPGSAENKNGLASGFQELTDERSLRRTGEILGRWTNRVVGGYKLVAQSRKALKGVMFRVERTDVPNLQAIPNVNVG
jgi:hypothetical protein